MRYKNNRYKNILRRFAASFIAMMMCISICYAREPAGSSDLNDNALNKEDAFADQILALGGDYGFMSTGTTDVKAKIKEYQVDYIWPEEIVRNSEGILFTDIHDYDADGENELLILRRQKGCINIDHSGRVSAQEQHEYIFEMYEYSDKTNSPYLASRFVAGVFDDYDLFTNVVSTAVFRRDGEGKPDIFMETYKRMQDHPQNISLIRLRYDAGYFVDYSGFRYGCIFWGDNCVQFQKFKTPAAFDFLSYPVRTDDSIELVAAADMGKDEAVTAALEEGLAEYGLTLRRTEEAAAGGTAREDQKTGNGDENTVIDAENNNDTNTTDKKDTNDSNIKDIDALMDLSALGGYDSAEGTLTALGYISAHGVSIGSEEGYDNVKLNCFSYTADPQGTDRGVLGE